MFQTNCSANWISSICRKLGTDYDKFIKNMIGCNFKPLRKESLMSIAKSASSASTFNQMQPGTRSTSVDGPQKVAQRRLFLFINPIWCDLTNRRKLTSVISFRFIINWIANLSKYNGTLISDWIDRFAYAERLCIWRNFEPRNSAPYPTKSTSRKLQIG